MSVASVTSKTEGVTIVKDSYSWADDSVDEAVKDCRRILSRTTTDSGVCDSTKENTDEIETLQSDSTSGEAWWAEEDPTTIESNPDEIERGDLFSSGIEDDADSDFVLVVSNRRKTQWSDRKSVVDHLGTYQHFKAPIDSCSGNRKPGQSKRSTTNSEANGNWNELGTMKSSNASENSRAKGNAGNDFKPLRMQNEGENSVRLVDKKILQSRKVLGNVSATSITTKAWKANQEINSSPVSTILPPKKQLWVKRQRQPTVINWRRATVPNDSAERVTKSCRMDSNPDIESVWPALSLVSKKSNADESCENQSAKRSSWSEVSSTMDENVYTRPELELEIADRCHDISNDGKITIESKATTVSEIKVTAGQDEIKINHETLKIGCEQVQSIKQKVKANVTKNGKKKIPKKRWQPLPINITVTDSPKTIPRNRQNIYNQQTGEACRTFERGSCPGSEFRGSQRNNKLKEDDTKVKRFSHVVPRSIHCATTKTEFPNNYYASKNGFTTRPEKISEIPEIDVTGEAIRKQVEYYFSEENLRCDLFLRRKMDREGYVPVTLIASFPRIVALTGDAIFVFKSILKSERLEIADGFRIRTKIDPMKWPLKDADCPIAADEHGEFKKLFVSIPLPDVPVPPKPKHFPLYAHSRRLQLICPNDLSIADQRGNSNRFLNSPHPRKYRAAVSPLENELSVKTGTKEFFRNRTKNASRFGVTGGQTGSFLSNPFDFLSKYFPVSHSFAKRA